MARIDEMGRWGIVGLWAAGAVISLPIVTMAWGFADEGAELPAAALLLTLPVLMGGVVAITWRWLTGESSS